MILSAISQFNEEINTLEEDGIDATHLRHQLPLLYQELRKKATEALRLSVEEHADLADAAYELTYGRMEDDPQAQPREWRNLLQALLRNLLSRQDITSLPIQRQALAQMREAAQRPTDRLGYAATVSSLRRTLPHPTPSLRPYL